VERNVLFKVAPVRLNSRISGPAARRIISIPESSRQEMFELQKKEFLRENGQTIPSGALDHITREAVEKSNQTVDVRA